MTAIIDMILFFFSSDISNINLSPLFNFKYADDVLMFGEYFAFFFFFA